MRMPTLMWLWHDVSLTRHGVKYDMRHSHTAQTTICDTAHLMAGFAGWARVKVPARFAAGGGTLSELTQSRTTGVPPSLLILENFREFFPKVL